ncbi:MULTISPECIES: RidA family protein [unclassified Rhodococcus (in: high G+C Gram-positive bacteria)]|uniref:RidA family protein n=1 Tax=unclassified Rhodococcus (in: high G+C Gram-positive bacteria) TaxID=192944 RepID=UPI00163AF577|nr:MULTISPECIES: RidA family protein [unclassified Rhodococcus (in: high G+C Gram-positive bacteria)]MBC2638771.1 RidA family protein [Rhodococcus sp. 3A]MBC2896488.1 RidA family protein [Rhodococcus sp. 4CII]
MGDTVDVPGVTTGTSPYPSARRVGDLVFVSGQVSFDDDGIVVGTDVGTQTRHCLTRLQRVLAAAGATVHDIASATVYLTNAANAAGFNEEWMRWFGGEHRPARATVVADLLDPRLLVEIQAVAVTGRGADGKEAE